MKMKIAIAAAILVAGLSAPALAFDGLRMRYVYYATVDRDEVVGYALIWCDGSATGNGYPTPYYDEEHYDCP
jgi:hypothetical protein